MKEQQLPDLNALRDDLLIALAKQGSSNTRALGPVDVLKEFKPAIDWEQNRQLARDAGWLLVRNQPPLAKTRTDTDKPSKMLLSLTAAGKALAADLDAARRPVSLKRRLSQISWGKGIWEVTKLTLAAVAGALAKSYFG